MKQGEKKISDVCNGIGAWFGDANQAYNKHAGDEYKIFPSVTKINLGPA